MVHVHGSSVQRLVEQTRGLPTEQLVAVPVDVGKLTAKALVCDFAGDVIGRPIEFPMNRTGIQLLVDHVEASTDGREVARVRLGVEACGHYHRPLMSSSLLPPDWQVIELNPAHVTEQRRVNGKRGFKTDLIDLAAIADLIAAGRGYEVRSTTPTAALAAWVAHRERRVAARSALKNQLLGQADRCFPGLAGSLADVIGTKVGALVLREFSDPQRLARLGVLRFRAFARRRGVLVRATVAARVVAAASTSIPTLEAPAAREVLARDLELLDVIDRQVTEAETWIAEQLPQTPFAILLTGPGWATVRVGRYGAAIGDPTRWPSPRHIYRASGLTPAVYESAGRRVDGGISREGKPELRRALVGLGAGLRERDPAARHYATTLRARGKPGGIVATALARRAGKIAFAMVRDQTPYNPSRWA